MLYTNKKPYTRQIPAHIGEDLSQVTTIQGHGQDLIQHIYHELRRLAEVKLRHQPNGGDTLQATALVHEVYMRLAKNRDKVWKGRRHFYCAAALAMRHILIDRARSKKAAKRGGGWQRAESTVTLSDSEDALTVLPEDLLTLNQALTKLRKEHPDLVELVLMRYYCGLTIAELARTLDMSSRTVERRWRFARAWLRKELRTLRS